MSAQSDLVRVSAAGVELEGDLVLPAEARDPAPAAALHSFAAARASKGVGALVSRGGRPALARPALPQVRAPTLLIVGELDEPVIAVNRSAMDQMDAEVELEIVPGATHLFEEPGKLETVTALARDWFSEHLGP